MDVLSEHAKRRRPSGFLYLALPLFILDMPPRSIPSDPTTILPPLLALVQSNAYSAHQKTRTTSARLISHGHTDEAISILFEVAKALLKKGEVGSGVDLATAMLKAYDEKAEQVSDVSRGELVLGEREAKLELTFLPPCLLLSFSLTTPHLGRCTNLIALCPSTGNWRKTVIDGAVKSVRFLPLPCELALSSPSF
jgi:hypothetical protein